VILLKCLQFLPLLKENPLHQLVTYVDDVSPCDDFALELLGYIRQLVINDGAVPLVLIHAYLKSLKGKSCGLTPRFMSTFIQA